MKESDRRCAYVVADCFPRTGSASFGEFAGGAVGCWVCSNYYDVEVDVIIERELSSEGWNIARILSREEVSDETYAKKSDGREFFEQAKVDGFVAQFHLRKRETIVVSGGEPEHRADELTEFVDVVRSGGGISLYSDAARQFANGVTPDGDEFLPLWLTKDEASTWLRHWPGYELRVVTAMQLASDFLDRLVEVDMWIGLGVGKSELIMAHPAWLKAALMSCSAMVAGKRI